MSAHRAGVVLLAGAICGCGPRDDALRLLDVRPAAGHVLRLNEPIVWEFDRPIDRTSVNSHSFQLDAGRPVPGAFRVRGKFVEFVPAPAGVSAAPDAPVAGWPAGGRVTACVVGYPARDGVQSSAQQPLANALAIAWPVTSATHGGDAFVDLDPNAPLSLHGGDGARTIAVLPQGWLRLSFSEPLDPSSVTPGAFPLEYDDAAHTRVPLELRVDATTDAYAVELRPTHGFVPTGARFVLECAALGVRDLLGGACRASATLTLVAGADAPVVAVLDDDSGRAP